MTCFFQSRLIADSTVHKADCGSFSLTELATPLPSCTCPGGKEKENNGSALGILLRRHIENNGPNVVVLIHFNGPMVSKAYWNTTHKDKPY